MAICGAKPHTVDMVSIRPDEVESVIYQTMAYCTREEPKSDMVWACLLYTSWSTSSRIPLMWKEPGTQEDIKADIKKTRYYGR